MNKHIFRFRCFAERHGRQWGAVCVDLGVAAQGQTYLEARTNLHAAMRERVHHILLAPLPVSKTLRRGPAARLRNHVKYAALGMLSKLTLFKRTSVLVFNEQTACSYMSVRDEAQRLRA